MEDGWERVLLYPCDTGLRDECTKSNDAFILFPIMSLSPFVVSQSHCFPTILPSSLSFPLPLPSNLASTPAPPIAIRRKLINSLEVTCILAETPLETRRLGSAELFVSRLRLGRGGVRCGLGFSAVCSVGTECPPANSLLCVQRFHPRRPRSCFLDMNSRGNGRSNLAKKLTPYPLLPGSSVFNIHGLGAILAWPFSGLSEIASLIFSKGVFRWLHVSIAYHLPYFTPLYRQ